MNKLRNMSARTQNYSLQVQFAETDSRSCIQSVMLQLRHVTVCLSVVLEGRGIMFLIFHISCIFLC
jgi:hypothetical protein